MKLPLLWLISGVFCTLCVAIGVFFLWSASTFMHTLEAPYFDDLKDPESKQSSPLITPPPSLGLNEVFVNVISGKTDNSHFLRFKLEVQSFSLEDRSLIEQRQPALRHTLIEASREMDYEFLSTLPGKLYFKEVLISRINEFLNQPAVKELHFTAFNLQ